MFGVRWMKAVSLVAAETSALQRLEDVRRAVLARAPAMKAHHSNCPPDNVLLLDATGAEIGRYPI